MKHLIPNEFRKRQVAIDLVGCGGTGSRLLPMLADLDLALRDMGHPGGLYIAVTDPDIVTEPSVGRTLFTASEVGQYKAAAAVERVNFACGTHYHSMPARYRYPMWNMARGGEVPDVVITCTDSLKSRVEIYQQMMTSGRMPPRYWLDCGNGPDFGQVILGEIDGHMGRHVPPLPTAVDVFPDMFERAADEEEEPESCTLADALTRQGLFINRHMAIWAGELLWQLFREGGLDYHGVFINARTGRTNPLAVPDPRARVQEQAPVELPEQTAPRGRRRIRSSAGACPQLGTNRRGRLTAGGVR